MNDIDKIKALLDQPNVKSVTCFHSKTKTQFDKEYSRVITASKFDYGQSYSLFSAPDRFDVNFHEWPEISEGDTVMTPHGEGSVSMALENGFKVRVSGYIGCGSKAPYFKRHEIALLSKSIKQ